jgi:MSHA biogenesis protein MshL
MNSLLIRSALAASSCLLLASCSISPGWRDSVRESMDDSMTRDRAGKPPAEVSQGLLPPLELTLPSGKAAPLEPRFDLNVNNAPARQVFLGLVEGSKYSVVIHPDVRGNLTLNLKEVSVPEAFDSIRRVYGYEYRREGNRFHILGREMQTRLFNVNYLNLVRKGKSDTRVSATGLQQTGASTAAGGAPTAESTSQTGVQVATESSSEFWKDMQATLSALIGTAGGRKVIVNAQTGIIAVRAMPDELRIVEDYLGATHATVNRQVILEAKIIDVELNDRFQTGINWAKLQGNYTASQVAGGSPDLATSGTTPFTGTEGPLFPGSAGPLQSAATLTDAFGGVFTLTAIANDFTALLELLKAQGEVQVLSSPRVSTTNNQKAVIKVGTDEFFVTKQDITQSNTVGVLPTVTTTLSPFFSGIALDVTPQIDEAGNINLHIHPSVSDVSAKNITIAITGGAVAQQLSTARSSIQESDNIVRAQSGQIIVIGGLIKEGSTDEDSSVPLLGDIPIVGNLFKHKRVTRIKKELVILLKPTVIQLDQDWGDAIGESQGRIKKIRIGS